jgi:hypothetical protein
MMIHAEARVELRPERFRVVDGGIHDRILSADPRSSQTSDYCRPSTGTSLLTPHEYAENVV